MSKLKEMLAMGGLAMATAVHPLPTDRAKSVRVGGQEIQSATLARKVQVAGR